MLKVLVALDGSPAAAQALELAAELLAGKEAEATLFHVMPRHLIYGKGGPVVAECYDPAEERASAVALLTGAAERLSGESSALTIKKEIEVGDPADLILAAAARDDMDLIVLGSRGLNAAQRFMLGSVSTKVATHAHCAALVSHPKVAVHGEVQDEATQKVAAV